MEYVAASKLEQHPILANQEEQFITLQIPEDFSSQRKSLGFTHIHFGTVRVTLTYHRRKGQPFMALVSLQNTRYYEYQHANLGTYVQILGAPKARDAIYATLHYQLAWKVQNHAMDLSLPSGQDALFLNVDATNGTTQCTQIPRQISREELVKVLPDSWVTNYEKLRDHPQPL
ncbi:hypothetical protein MTR67_051973 [Solanum verrucosum]|uniref:Uncharacterized protein n=1 Tax=Solanum verrucosum TaxID=315347 RepID=A0AAF0V8F8_SOLVR|nr:hypothetical protein MTR67_051973 [Solanum verrucosum]